MSHNPIKVCSIGIAGADSLVGPIFCLCICRNESYTFDSKTIHNIENYNVKETFDERANNVNSIVKCFSTSVVQPKDNSAEEIKRSVNACIVKAILNIHFTDKKGNVFTPEIVVCKSGLLSQRFNDLKIMEVDKETTLNKLCNILADNVRKRYIDQLCEMEPILKIYGLQENYGFPDKKHKRAIKQNGTSAFHRKNILRIKDEKSQ